MVERTAAKRKLIIPVPDRKGYTLLHVLKRFVNPESIIYSDCWKGYSKIKDYFSGHLYVNHSLGFKDPITGVHTNTIEGSWGAIKAKIPKAYRTKTRLWPYLIRYMIMCNEQGIPIINLIKYLF